MDRMISASRLCWRRDAGSRRSIGIGLGIGCGLCYASIISLMFVPLPFSSSLSSTSYPNTSVHSSSSALLHLCYSNNSHCAQSQIGKQLQDISAIDFKAHLSVDSQLVERNRLNSILAFLLFRMVSRQCAHPMQLKAIVSLEHSPFGLRLAFNVAAFVPCRCLAQSRSTNDRKQATA